MNIDLKGLRYFVAVAEQGSVGKAAELLHMAQPPLSTQIRKLESRLGAPLFIRHPSGMQLTEAGSALFSRAREAISLANEGVTIARAIAAGERGRLVVGYMVSLGYALLPQLLPLLRKQLRHVEIQFVEMNARTSVQLLLDRKLDFGICMPPVVHPAVAAVNIGRQTLRLATRVTSPFARMSTVDVGKLQGHPLIALPTMVEDSASSPVATMLRRHGVSMRVVDRVETVHAALALVLAGDGHAVVPACTQLGVPRGVVLRPLAGCDDAFDVAVCHRTDSAWPLHQVFTDIARTAYRAISYA